jgi:hypothetical protein
LYFSINGWAKKGTLNDMEKFYLTGHYCTLVALSFEKRGLASELKVENFKQMCDLPGEQVNLPLVLVISGF